MNDIRERLTEKLGKQIDRKKINLCDRIINQSKYNLNLEQQEYVESRRNCKKSDILEIAQEVYKNPTLIEQSQEFKNVRKYIEKVWRNSQEDDYSDDQLDFIFENAGKISVNDIALALFPDKPAVVSVRTIAWLIDAAGIKKSNEEPEPDKVYLKYNPPKTDLQIVNLINKSDFSAKYDYDKLDNKKKESIAAVKKFLSAPRFVEHMSSMTNLRHREVFETEFVKAVYNKLDLNSDQVNMYINLALEYVNLLEIKQQITILNDRLVESVSDDDEGRKFTMSLSEALKDKTASLNQCSARIQSMIKSLTGDRVKQLEKQAAANQSLAQFVELVKDEQERKRMMLVARAHEFQVQEKIKELESFPELFVEVFGIGKDEVFSL